MLLSADPCPPMAPTPSTAPVPPLCHQPRYLQGPPRCAPRLQPRGHPGDDGRHVGGAAELDPGQAVLVGLHHALASCWGGGESGPLQPFPRPLGLLPSHSSSSGLKLMAKSWDTSVDTSVDTKRTCQPAHPLRTPTALPTGRDGFGAPGADRQTCPGIAPAPGSRGTRASEWHYQ